MHMHACMRAYMHASIHTCIHTACMHSSIRVRIGIGKAMAVMTPGSLSLADTATVINPKP